MIRRLAAPALLLPLLLAGCGSLPEPMRNNPGAAAVRLSRPPPARLDVPAPPEALLPDHAASAFARDVAGALAVAEVPAIPMPAQKGDWRLSMTAVLHGDQVVPTYTVLDPAGHARGAADGPPVPAAAWSAGDPAVLKQAAETVAPKLAGLLTRIEAVILASDPHSLMNRPARVGFTGVTGAPGDGNISLARQMRQDLAGQGEVVQDSASGADFTLKGQVHVAPAPGGQQRVEIQWIVADARGREAGRVVQIHDVQAGLLSGYWGDVAMVVAQQAAPGVRQVIVNNIGPRPKDVRPRP